MHLPGIEPGSHRWQRCILPLNHRCFSSLSSFSLLVFMTEKKEGTVRRRGVPWRRAFGRGGYGRVKAMLPPCLWRSRGGGTYSYMYVCEGSGFPRIYVSGRGDLETGFAENSHLHSQQHGRQSEGAGAREAGERGDGGLRQRAHHVRPTCRRRPATPHLPLSALRPCTTQNVVSHIRECCLRNEAFLSTGK